MNTTAIQTSYLKTGVVYEYNIHTDFVPLDRCSVWSGGILSIDRGRREGLQCPPAADRSDRWEAGRYLLRSPPGSRTSSSGVGVSGWHSPGCGHCQGCEYWLWWCWSYQAELKLDQVVLPPSYIHSIQLPEKISKDL